MKVTKQCAVCSSTEIYTNAISSRGEGINLLPDASRWLDPAQLEVYVCGTCGYYQCFVPPEWLPDVKQHWRRLA